MAKFSADNQPQRRRGKGWRQLVLESLQARGMTEQDFADALVARALDSADPCSGRAMIEVLARLAPIPKATAPLVEFAFPQDGSMVEKIDAVIAATAQGELPADLAALLVGIMKTRVDVHETTELAARLAALEAALARTRTD